MTNIIIIDDHFIALNGFASLMEALGFNVICKALNQEELNAFIKTTNIIPDIAFVDIKIDADKLGGTKIAKAILQQYPTIKIIAVSSDSYFYRIKQMIINGACSFIAKVCRADDYPRIIQKIIEGEKVFLLELIENNKVVLQKFTEKQILHHTADLSDNEMAFLRCCGTGFTYDEIALKLNKTVHQIEYIRKAICEKINIDSRQALAVYAIECGLA